MTAARLFIAALGLAALAAAQVGRTPPKPKVFEPGPPIEQPIPFSHKLHSALGVECRDCHAVKEPGDFAGLPSAAKCMACHVAVKPDSPHVLKLAKAEKDGKPIEWKRVYEVEEFVYFSHAVHLEAEAVCADCHGPVADREVLARERPVSMYACMKCHDERDAPNDCELCHDTH